MKTIKPIKIGSNKTNMSEKLTAAEMGKLWATYTGNSMSICILRYYLAHVVDPDIKSLLEHALKMAKDFLARSNEILDKEGFPIPKGFGEEDVNLGAPRLFEDEFYIHYLKYAAKAGMSIYTVAIPIVYRRDVSDFFTECMLLTTDLMNRIKDLLDDKGFLTKPPIIPVPDKVEYATKEFLNGYLGHVRPLHALEIAHFYDNIENNVASKALILAFTQVVKDEKIYELFQKGVDLTASSIESYMKMLHNENLPTPTYLDHLVTKSTFSPFSDRLMLFHKMDMFSMKMRAFGNSIAVNGRHDVGLLYTKSLMKISVFVETAARIMTDKGWMETPPQALDRKQL